MTPRLDTCKTCSNTVRAIIHWKIGASFTAEDRVKSHKFSEKSQASIILISLLRNLIGKEWRSIEPLLFYLCGQIVILLGLHYFVIEEA
mmetsp:Transcript_968/g.1587  ORF Transcript_968/g.1587 Transcript_968/m.1587 type:complete len:89 (+) Transcript_968:1973-2239(+)